MGLFDWVLRPFRRATEPEASPEPWSADLATPAPAPSRAEKKAKALRERAEQAVRPKAEKRDKPKREKRPKGSKKQRKAAQGAAPRLTGPARPVPAAEVLSVEEAERRYGAMVREAEARRAEPRVDDETPAPAREPAPVADAGRDAEAEARRAAADENRRRARVPRFEALLSRADALLAVPEAELRHLRAAREDLVEGWSRLGDPPADRLEQLEEARDSRLDALDDRIAAAATTLEEEYRENLAEKQAIVEQAQALAERDDLKGAGPAMGELRAKLRATGPVSPADREAVSAAFAAAEARLKERQQQAREEFEAGRREALERLNRLVSQAESLVALPDAEQAAERAKGLQAQWKTVKVPGPRGQTDEAWTRFRAACDAIFARRSEARIEASRVTLERMEAIVARAEALAEDLEGDPEAVIERLMTDWKRAGRAPREAQNALWERLQSAFGRIRNPPVDWKVAEDPGLAFRPFEALNRDDE